MVESKPQNVPWASLAIRRISFRSAPDRTSRAANPPLNGLPLRAAVDVFAARKLTSVSCGGRCIRRTQANFRFWRRSWAPPLDSLHNLCPAKGVLRTAVKHRRNESIDIHSHRPLADFHRLRPSRCCRFRFGHRNAARPDQPQVVVAHSRLAARRTNSLCHRE